MTIHLGRHITSHRRFAFEREWLVTNGIGGYASGTVGGARTRRYHGLLVGALGDPVRRHVLLAGMDVWLQVGTQRWPLTTHSWTAGVIFPDGYIHLQQFDLDGTLPVWTWSVGITRLQQRIWMDYQENTTYVTWTYLRGQQPITLYLKPLVTYRTHHDITRGGSSVNVKTIHGTAEHPVGLSVLPDNYLGIAEFDQPLQPFYVMADRGLVHMASDWWWDFHLPEEKARGLDFKEDLYQVGTIQVELGVGETFSMACTTDPEAVQPWQTSLQAEQQRQRELIVKAPLNEKPAWLEELILAADQFVVQDINIPDTLHIMSGYPWFGVWGRHTMSSLTGLTSLLGQQERARQILLTFTHYLDQGMLPHHIADETGGTSYNSIDATLWYFVALWAYMREYPDDVDLLRDLYPMLTEAISWYRKGTRYHIAQDPIDHLLYGGEDGEQLTWMDVKLNDFVVTPRIGKPVEVNALWYNALRIMQDFSSMLHLHDDAEEYAASAKEVAVSFNDYFWSERHGYLYDVIDTPFGTPDSSLRPNQLLAISLPYPVLQNRDRARQVVDACAAYLLTSYGLRTLDYNDVNYVGEYKGDANQREYALHQGTVWAWLIGPFISAYWYAYQDLETAYSFLEPFVDHMMNHGVGTIGEIFDGNAPHLPRGAISYALSVAEVLRVWYELERIRHGVD